MSKDEGEDGGTPGGLRAPDGVSLSARSWFGPFAGLFRGRLIRVPPKIVPIVNDGPTALRIVEAAADPLREEETGLEAGGSIRVVVEPPELGSGAAGRAVLSSEVQGVPGRYASALRFRADPGKMPLVVPLTLTVAASPLWGIGCLILGLIALGAVNVLSTEGALRAKQRDVLLAAQAFHEGTEKAQLPQRYADDVAAIDREYAVALRSLGAPRPLGVIDRRAADAELHLAAAERMGAELTKAVGGLRPGEAEIRELLADWKAYEDVAHDVGRLAPPLTEASARAVPGAKLGALVDGYQARFAQRFVRLPVEYNLAQLNDLILEIRLAASAGRIDEARARALAARRWLQRASDDLASGLALMKNQKLLGFNLVSNANQVQQRLEQDDLPTERKAAMQAWLDQAAAVLAPSATGHEDDLAMAAANRLVAQAAVDMTRARTDMVLQRFNAAIAAASAQTGLDDVNNATAREQAARPAAAEARIAGLRRILEVWRGKVAEVEDAAMRARMAAQIDVIVALLDHGELKGVGRPYNGLLQLWTDYGMMRVEAATASVMKPVCEQDKAGDLVRIAQLTEEVRQHRPGPQLAAWEQALDRIRADMLRVDPASMTKGAECRTVLGEIEQRMLTLGNEQVRVDTMDAAIPLSEQRAAFRTLGFDTAQLEGPRQLGLDIVTPAAEREVGRRIRFSLTNADPSWSAPVTVAVDFGDGSTPFRASAEAIARGLPIEHEYGRTVLARLRVAAAEHDDPLTPGVRLLGQGNASVSISPSEITAAETFADAFLNARFALALLIAAVVYYWRYHSGKKAFGAQGFDYVEAFALGFAVNAAVTDLPGQVVRIVSGG